MTKYLFDSGRLETVVGLGAVKSALEFFFGPLEAQPLASQLFGFYTGLAYFAPILGGLVAFKPNISTQVGALYAPGDDRRDRAYSIFYLGINIGAFLAPLICGTLAVQYGWHYGFGAAGVGMLVSLAIYLCGRRSLPADDPPRDSLLARENKPLEPGERRALLALIG